MINIDQYINMPPLPPCCISSPAIEDLRARKALGLSVPDKVLAGSLLSTRSAAMHLHPRLPDNSLPQHQPN